MGRLLVFAALAVGAMLILYDDALPQTGSGPGAPYAGSAAPAITAIADAG